jgi:hypothetical protein
MTLAETIAKLQARDELLETILEEMRPVVRRDITLMRSEGLPDEVILARCISLIRRMVEEEVPNGPNNESSPRVH